MTIVLFLVVSTDGFTVMTAIFADSEQTFDRASIAGAMLSVATVTMLGLALARAAAKAEGVTRRLEALSPFAMIGAGVYVLLDTPTDVS